MLLHSTRHNAHRNSTAPSVSVVKLIHPRDETNIHKVLSYTSHFTTPKVILYDKTEKGSPDKVSPDLISYKSIRIACLLQMLSFASHTEGNS